MLARVTALNFHRVLGRHLGADPAEQRSPIRAARLRLLCQLGLKGLKESLPSVSYTGDPARLQWTAPNQWSTVASVELKESQKQTKFHESKKGDGL